MTPLKLKIAMPALVFAFASSWPAAAQVPPAPPGTPTRVQVGIGVPGGMAVADFGANVGMSGGISAGFDVGLGRSIVSLGVEGAYVLYGMDSREVDLGPAIPELAGTRVTVDNDNQMFLLHGRVRVQPRHGRWRPYADGLVGFNYIFTTTSIDQGTSCGTSSCQSLETTNLDDLVPSVGAGVGVMVGLGSSPGATRLDVSVRYLRGGEASYLAKGAIHNRNGVAVLDISRSRIDMVMVTIGLAFGR